MTNQKQSESLVKQKQANEVVNGQGNDLVALLSSQQILTESDTQAIVDAKEFIASTLTDVPMYRPLPVKLFGVLNDADFPTPESKFWQCKVEAEVHANELIRDIHDMEIAKVDLDRAQHHLEVMQEKLDELNSTGITDTHDQKEVELDIKEQTIRMSRQRFELTQVEKRIKYRIDEVKEWKTISDNLANGPKGFTTSDYISAYTNTMISKWEKKAKQPGITDEEKSALATQIAFVKKSIDIFSQ